MKKLRACAHRAGTVAATATIASALALFGGAVPQAGAVTPGAAVPHAANVSGLSPQAYSFEWDEAVDDGGYNHGPGDYDRPMTCVYTTASEACYMPDGDYIWVYDSAADGASAVARWYTDYGRWGTCRNAMGAGTWGLCNKNFAEGHTIYFRASQYDGDTGSYVGGESSLQSSST